MSKVNQKHPMASRFRGFLPVVVDVETAGYNPKTDALLEVAIVLLKMGDRLERSNTLHAHVLPFPGANLRQSSLEFTGIDPYHPFRLAVPEREALETIFQSIHQTIRDTSCTRAVLVGHNASFDLEFIKAATERSGIKNNPFHSFTVFDTATLSGLAFGQTVLAKAVQLAGFPWDAEEAHSAQYDAESTADLFCTIVNRWDSAVGKPGKEI